MQVLETPVALLARPGVQTPPMRAGRVWGASAPATSVCEKGLGKFLVLEAWLFVLGAGGVVGVLPVGVLPAGLLGCSAAALVLFSRARGQSPVLKSTPRFESF